MSHEPRAPREGAGERGHFAEPSPVLEPGGTAAETSAHISLSRGAGALGPATTRRRQVGKAGRSVRKHATAEKRKPATKLPRKQHLAAEAPMTGSGRFKPRRAAGADRWSTEEKVAGRKPSARQKKHVKTVERPVAAKRATARRGVLTAPVVPPAGPIATGRRSGATRMGDARARNPQAPKGAPLRHKRAPRKRTR